jgi:hypothetical protein
MRRAKFGINREIGYFPVIGQGQEDSGAVDRRRAGRLRPRVPLHGRRLFWFGRPTDNVSKPSARNPEHGGLSHAEGNQTGKPLLISLCPSAA